MTTAHSVRIVGLALTLVIGASTSSGAEPSEPPRATPSVGAAAPDCRAAPDDCTTRELADAAGLSFGVSASPDPLTNDAAYANIVRTTFNSVTPENELKWFLTEPESGIFNFAPADTTIGWAQNEGIAIKGHTLIWEQRFLDGQPDWVDGLNDPEELWRAVDSHITTVLEHTSGRVDRWDVVNEPLEFLGSTLACNQYNRVLGPNYVARALRRAHEVDPNISLWVNEHSVEYDPAKADALVSLAASLVAQGVPIDGIGLQMHLVAGAPAPGVVRNLVTRLRALGLKVAITEMDVATLPDQGGEAGQAAVYRQVLTEYFQAGGREVTIWGVDDSHSWLPTDPLLFDGDYQPKPALEAVRQVIVDQILNAPAPAPVPPVSPSAIAPLADGCNPNTAETPTTTPAGPLPGTPTLTG